MGLLGSLMASTCRSNQSFTAWLLAHTNGPANKTPQMIKIQLSVRDFPEETTPHENAHIGGNHVMGFKSSATVESSGRCIREFS
jgi:hypothetical protein